MSHRAYKVGDPDWDGVRVHVGLLGPVTKITYQLVPDFATAVTVYVSHRGHRLSA